jgi:4'-phosphopantetheinyl transferase EntD
MIERLVPAGVVTAETREELIEVELFPDERRTLGRAVEKRRREFVTGRACARRALGELGVPATAIPNGERGEPLWPPGIVGSITHCQGYRASAVARIGPVLALGIDAEVNAALPAGVLDEVAFGRERELVADEAPVDIDGGLVHLDRLLFSAKEAVYKAWFPLARRWLGFEDARVSIDPEQRTFGARLLVPGPEIGGKPLTQLEGRWWLEDGVIATAVVISPVESL